MLFVAEKLEDGKSNDGAAHFHKRKREREKKKQDGLRWSQLEDVGTDGRKREWVAKGFC